MFSHDELTLVNGLILMLVALATGAIGGAIGGILVGGKALGNELAAMMGACYGPVASVPGVAVALFLLALMM